MTTLAAAPARPTSPLLRAADRMPQTTALIIGGLVWELLGRLADLAFLPPLSVVLLRLVELTRDGLILASTAASVLNLLIGFTFSVVVGTLVGLAMGISRRVSAALDIYVNALLTAPSLVFAPIFFSLFGLSNMAIIALIIMYAVFIIIVSTKDAVRSVPQPLVEMARCYGASRRQLYRTIVVPAALPLIGAGIRVGAARAVKGMVNGEMFISVVGLGALIMDAGRTFDAASILAVLLVVLVIARILTKLIEIADRRLNGWVPSSTR